ncbi:MAG: cytochrome c oxidase assembly protein [Acidimicrobiales bacterium]|nr:cytochrome c oxidase assembly protein [Acidimicrobiales bacterium]MDG2216997.1 cytochrome c oxidase assembly protein [Acidimicrobiales bacterium]
MTALLAVSAWEYELHPEVWLLIAAVVVFGVYSVRSIGPLAVTDGTPIITAPQKRYFLAGVLLLWLAADWPMHDIAEKHLYSVHMIQHLLISFIVPPLLLLAMPAWLARLLILDDGLAQRLLRPLTKPLVAGLLFNMFQILTHWGAVVNLSVENGAFHYALHLGVFFSALLMWFPILGPLKEMQMSEPGKMIYLFLMSVVPTVPAGWLTFAEGVVYSSYNHSDPLWGVSPTHDQQVAGVVMKIIGGFYLWSLIALRFMRFAGGQREADMAARQNRSPVTSTEAEREFIDAENLQ